MRISQVCTKWRRAILDTGEVRKRINDVDKAKYEKDVQKFLTRNYGGFDQILVYCYFLIGKIIVDRNFQYSSRTHYVDDQIAYQEFFV